MALDLQEFGGKLRRYREQLQVSVNEVRNLQPHIDHAYMEALRCRLMDQQTKTEVNALNVQTEP